MSHAADFVKKYGRQLPEGIDTAWGEMEKVFDKKMKPLLKPFGTKRELDTFIEVLELLISEGDDNTTRKFIDALKEADAKKGKGPGEFGKMDKAPKLLVAIDQASFDKMFKQLKAELKKQKLA